MDECHRHTRHADTQEHTCVVQGTCSGRRGDAAKVGDGHGGGGIGRVPKLAGGVWLGLQGETRPNMPARSMNQCHAIQGTEGSLNIPR